jgi:hypothetical protein
MGFNYLQTDDRDDYFAQFSNGKTHKPCDWSLVNPDGVEIISHVPTFVLRSYCKKTYLSQGQSGKRIWRKLLEDKGYKIVKTFK